MIRRPICLVEWLDMLECFLLLKILKPICRFISIRDCIAMGVEFTSRRRLRLSINEGKDFLMRTEGHLGGILSRFRRIHPVALSSRPIPLVTQVTLGLLSGPIERRISSSCYSHNECILLPSTLRLSKPGDIFQTPSLRPWVWEVHNDDLLLSLILYKTNTVYKHH